MPYTGTGICVLLRLCFCRRRCVFFCLFGLSHQLYDTVLVCVIFLAVRQLKVAVRVHLAIRTEVVFLLSDLHQLTCDHITVLVEIVRVVIHSHHLVRDIQTVSIKVIPLSVDACNLFRIHCTFTIDRISPSNS